MMRGSVQIEQARNVFKELLELVVEIASLQTAFIKLDKVIKVTSRRVNALEFIVIPKFKDTLRYIQTELDELEREEKFTLKKVIDNRKKIQELIDLKEEKARRQDEDREVSDDENNNILDDDDDDLLF